MNETTLKKLEYDKIKDKVMELTLSPAGRTLAQQMRPSSEYRQAAAWLRETAEAADLLNSGASIPLSAMEGIEAFLALLGKGRIYSEAELDQLAVWMASVVQMKKYMTGKNHIAPTIAAYAESMYDCAPLRDELNKCIRYGQLTDQASLNLANIRRHIYATEDKIARKMEQALNKYRSSLQEPVISKRSNRFVIAVKRELRKQVPGTVLDESASGQTLFVEPSDVAVLQQELQQWIIEQERERQIILANLSQLAERYSAELRRNVEAMAAFDFIIARAKLSNSMNGQRVELSEEPQIRLIEARHPLLGGSAVPLHAELGLRWKQLIITGPNTGGKTITLKTIGLLALMAQSGLLIPADKRSVIGVFRHIVADVGDGQSIEQSLSTFSSHITVLKEMLDCADSRSLLLLDELAAGTDPSEGIALSIALLERLLTRQALVAATTHFNEIKAFAARTSGCQNGKMAFDADTLKPLYRLEIGEAGDSHAFAIARRFGLPEAVMQRAEQLLGAGSASAIWEGAESVRPAGDPPTGRSEKRKGNRPHPTYLKGDAVWIYPLKRAGIVYRPADERGNVIVQVKGSKLTFNHKRLKPYIPKSKLYPDESYDLDIVFESKENRKARNLMRRKHVDGLTIVTPAEDAD